MMPMLSPYIKEPNMNELPISIAVASWTTGNHYIVCFIVSEMTVTDEVKPIWGFIH